MNRIVIAAALALASNVANAGQLSDAGWNTDKVIRVYAIAKCSVLNKSGMLEHAMPDATPTARWDRCIRDMETGDAPKAERIGRDQMGLIVLEEMMRTNSTPNGESQ
jgi:hypothetical protein